MDSREGVPHFETLILQHFLRFRRRPRACYLRVDAGVSGCSAVAPSPLQSDPMSCDGLGAARSRGHGPRTGPAPVARNRLACAQRSHRRVRARARARRVEGDPAVGSHCRVRDRAHARCFRVLLGHHRVHLAAQCDPREAPCALLRLASRERAAAVASSSHNGYPRLASPKRLWVQRLVSALPRVRRVGLRRRRCR